MKFSRIWTLGLVCVGVTGLAMAQPPEPPPDEDAKPPAVAPSTPGKLKDPTNVSPKMREVLGSKTVAGAAPRISPLALRGRVLVKDKPASALLEVDGKLYTVSKGSVLAGPNNLIYHVLEVNADEVRVEVTPNKQTIILR